MRIEPVGGKVVNPYAKVNQVNIVDSPQKASQLDSFEISEDAKTLSVALKQSKAEIISSMETVRAGKVNQIKKQIENGQYRIDSLLIASSLMNLEEE